MTKRCSLLVLILSGICLLAACTPENKSGETDGTGSSEETIPLADGMKRFKIRFFADSGFFDNILPLDLSKKTVRVNGLEYSPRHDDAAGIWFVDVEESSFGVYTAELLSEGSAIWHGENPSGNILIPPAQILHKTGDLLDIPLVANYDAAKGDYLDFIPPYAVLDFTLSETPVSIRISASSPLCGFLSWKRSDNSIVYGDSFCSMALNCTGEPEHAGGHYPVIVYGTSLKDVSVRVCDSSHKMAETQLGDIEIEKGTVRSFNLNDRPQNDLLWFEGFDLCAWGGDAAAGKNGVSPSEFLIDLKGDDTLDGYEWATYPADATAPGSGFIQQSYAEGATVENSHSMSGSYILSRGFSDYQYMLRCRECPGYISLGTGNTARGVFTMYPLKGTDPVKNIEVSFRLCLGSMTDDNIQLLSSGSSAVIKEWYLDGVLQSPEALSLKRTTATLTIDRKLLGTEWKTVRAVIENCTDASSLSWQASTTDSGNHGFYLDDIMVREIPGGWSHSDRLRILYWNIQNGMWADQYEYDNFVAFVNKFSPDICVWCEAKSNYESGSADRIEDEEKIYLPDNWDKLARRYGHSYVGISRRGLEGFPQVVTSRFPVEKLHQMDYISPEETIMHGAGIFKVSTPAGGYYFVTLHLNPYKDEEGESVQDGIRLREITKIIQESVLNPEWPRERGWFVLGDFNSHSRKDAAWQSLEEDSSAYWVHDYINTETSLVDLLSRRYPRAYMSTTFGLSRFDYIYLDDGSYGRVRDAGVLTTGWTAPVFTGISNFYLPSDHRPILVDLEY